MLVLPSPDADSRNVRLLVGSHAQKRRRFTIDIRNLEACPGSRASADDGLTPRLRWQLYPPPLTIFSAKFLLGWMSLDLLVPPAAPKRAPSGRWQEPPLPMELAEPWTAHRDPETGRTFYYNATTKDAIWHKPREPLRLPLDVELPEPWEAHRAQGTDWIFYYNKVTGESTWDSPRMTPPSQPEPRAERTSDVGSAGQASVDRVYSAAEVDERGRLKPKPKPKRRPAQLRQEAQTTEGEIPRDARLEILAGDLVLRSANAVSTTDKCPDRHKPVQNTDSTRPTRSVESSAASSRPTQTSVASAPAAPRRGVKRGSQTGASPRDPRRRPPSIWFMEDDPDDAPVPPPKVKAKPKAKPRSAGAKARMMSTLLKISRANRAAVATKTGTDDSPLPREPYSSAVPTCRSALSSSSWLDGASLRSCWSMRSRWDDTGTRCASATLPCALPSAVCRCLPLYRACLHQAADLCSRSWVDSSPWALVPLQGGLRMRALTRVLAGAHPALLRIDASADDRAYHASVFNSLVTRLARRLSGG